MESEMKSGPSIRQKEIRAPAFFGLPAGITGKKKKKKKKKKKI